MGRSMMTALPIVAVIGVGGWWAFGRDTRPKSLDPLDESAIAAEEEQPSDAGELRGGLKAMTVAPVTSTSPYRIDGVVIDEKGKPVEDLAVRARSNGKTRDPDEASLWGDSKLDDPMRKEFAGIDDPKVVDGSNDPTGKSDKDGKFSIPVPEAGSYAISVVPVPGKSSASAWANPTKMKPVARVTVKLLPGTPLTGRVVDADDKGVVSFVSGTVTTASTGDWGLSSVEIPSTATDSSGAFVFPAVPDGKATLTVKVAGRGTFSGFVFTAPAKDAVVLKIGASGVIKGHVADSAGQAVANADISVSTSALKAPPAGSPRASQVRGKTQPDGTYRLEGVVSGPVKRVAVAATGYSSSQQTPPAAKWSGAEVKDGAETVVDVVVVRGGTVTGRVLDQSEKGSEVPVTDAEVFLLGPSVSNAMATQGQPRYAAVDRDGRFKFEDAPLGKYVVYARSPSHYLPGAGGGGNANLRNGRMYQMDGMVGGSGTTNTVVLTKEGETFEKIVFMLKGVPVSGVVKGPDGSPVEGAKVRSAADGGFQNAWQYGMQPQGPMVLATSGSDGRFQIAGIAPSDQCVLTASKPPLSGKPCKAFKVKADAPVTDVVLELEKGASIAGRVIDADGAPVGGAYVQAWSQDGRGGQANETTGADGTYKLDGLAAGGYQMGAWSQTGNGGSANKALETPLTAGEAREGVELKMVVQKKGAKLSGRLVDEEGNGIATSQLSAQGANGSSGWAQTDEDGAFTFGNLAEGKVTISVQVRSADGGYYGGQEAIENATFDVPGEGVKVVMKKKTTVTIGGRALMPDGSPVPLCTLTIKASSSDKSSSGSASSVQYVSGGMYYGPGGGGGEVVNGEFRREVASKLPLDVVISAAKDSEGRPLNLKSSTTKVTEASTSLEIKLESGLEIRGKVVGADGTPVVGAWISAGTANDRSADDGSFKLVGLEGEEASISVQPTEKYTAPAKPTKAKPGATDVVIHLESGLAISGKVFDPAGSPVKAANVMVVGGSGGGRNQFQAQTDDQGAFKVENLPKDGSFDVSVQLWNQGIRGVTYKPWSKSAVKAGTDDLIVRLEVGATIEGTVVDADGKPAVQCSVQAQLAGGGRGGNPQMANADDQGRFICGGLEVGAMYVVKAQRYDGSNRSSLPVRAEAGSKDVRLVFPLTTKLSGRLTGDGDKSKFSVVVRPSGPIMSEADTQLGQARTMADGTFSIDVPVDVTVDIYVSKWDDDRYGFVSGVRSSAGDVVVRVEVGKTIEGTIEDADGIPVTQNAWVTASNDAWMAYGMVDAAAGKFRVRGLPPGRYRLKPMNNTGAANKATPVDADAGATGVRLRLGG